MLAPVIVTGLNDSGNIIINWVRCSRVPGIEQDNWSQQYWSAPLDTQDERYEVDIINNSGSVVRTLYAYGAPTTTYTLSSQISDFGSVQASYTINVYQSDVTLGRGTYRQAVFNVSSLRNLQHYFNPSIDMEIYISITAGFSIVHGVFPLPFIFGGAPVSSVPLGGTM